MRFNSLLTFVFSLSALSAIQSRADDFQLAPGYLDDFSYQMTEVGTRGAIDAFTGLNRNTEMTSICANRANLWAYEMDHRSMKATNERLMSSKVFLFFTEKTQATEDKLWWYHVAPAILADGQIKVIDGAFPNGIRGPVSIETWNAYFSNGAKCTELKGSDIDVIEEIRKAQALPTTKGNCYYRVAPMFYLSPISLVWHDVDSKKSATESPTPGINTQTPFNPNRWLKSDLVGSCEQGQDRGFSLRRKSKWCEKFLRLGKWDDGTGIVSTN